MRLLTLLLISSCCILGLVADAWAAKPTITVIIPGWSSGDGRRIEPPALQTIGEQAGNTMAGAGANNTTIYYKWPSHGNNKQSVDDLAKQIKQQAAAMGTEVDLNIVGHSRGGIVATDVMGKIAQDKQFGHVQGVLLDPTGANSAGDQFPTKKPAGVDRLVNYYDGKNGINIGGVNSDSKTWRNTQSDRDIEGAENYKVDLKDSNSHVTIVGSYAKEEDYPVLQVKDDETHTTHDVNSDSQSFYNSKEGRRSNSPVPTGKNGTNTNVVLQAPKSDQEHLTAAGEKGLHDLFDQIGRSATDIGREGDNVRKGDIGSENSHEHWGRMADDGWVHGRDLVGDGGKQLGANIENGWGQTKELTGRGVDRAKQNIHDFAKDPGRTIQKGLAHNGRELERLTNHYVDGGSKLAEHELNMTASGVQHAGRLVDKYGENLGQGLKADGDLASRLLMANSRKGTGRAVARPIADTLRESTKFGGDTIRESSKLGGDALRESGNAVKDLTRESGKATRELSGTASKAAKDALTESGKAAGDIGRETKQTTDKLKERTRVFAGNSDKEAKRAGGNIARETKDLPKNLEKIAERPDEAIGKGRDNTKRVFADTEKKVGSAVSGVKQKAQEDAAKTEKNVGKSLSNTRDRVVADGAKNADRAGQAANRTKERVYSQAAKLDENAGKTLTQARDRANDHLANAEQSTGKTVSRTRDRVVAKVQQVDPVVNHVWRETREQTNDAVNRSREQAGNVWNQARQQGGNGWNQGREQLGNAGNWFQPPRPRPNPLADIGRAFNQALVQEQSRQQAQRAQQEALRARLAAQQQAEMLRRQAQEQARQLAISRENAARQAQQAQQWAQEQARRRQQELAAAAQRAQKDVSRELQNAGGYIQNRGNAISSGAKKVFGF